MEDTIGIDDLVKTLIEHLAESDEKYRRHYAMTLGVDTATDHDALAEVEKLLSDPDTEPSIIIDLANKLLSPSYAYDGDSIVTVTHPEDFPRPSP